MKIDAGAQHLLSGLHLKDDLSKYNSVEYFRWKKLRMKGEEQNRIAKIWIWNE